MNRGEIRILAAKFLNDPNLRRYKQAEYDDAIDKAAQEFCFDTKAYYKDAPTYTTVAGQSEYTLPTDFWLERQITHKGLEMRPVSENTLQLENTQDWRDDEGTPTLYIMDASEDRKYLRLWRIPQANDAGANLILSYFPIPAAMSSDSEKPFGDSSMMAQFHFGIAAKAAMIMLSFRKITPEIMAKKADLSDIYGDKIAQAKDSFGVSSKEPWRMPTGWG